MQTTIHLWRWATFLSLIAVFGSSAPLRAADRPTDAAVTQRVAAVLASDLRLPTGRINVTTESGIVTLDGSVDNLAQRRMAELETEKIRGVRAVIDRLGVRTVVRSDADLRTLVRRRIANSLQVPSGQVVVDVKDGAVSLSGRANSFIEKEESGLLAAQVRGVSGVTNEMTVVYRHPRSDQDIRRDVRARFRLDAYLVDAPIEVDVKAGVVTLSGTVRSPYEKTRALVDTYAVHSVTGVHNGISVAAGGGTVDRDPDKIPGDRQLALAVREALALDLRIEPSGRIHITADDGHVILYGTVASYHQKRLAQQDAKNVVGVAWLSNLIEVHVESRDDDTIRRAARFNIDTDGVLKADGIKVFVRDGAIMLTGSVPSFFQKARAENDVARIAGVADVVNNLDVNRKTPAQDTVLKDRVLLRLAADWATWPQLDNIAVNVRDGHATLTGRVLTWRQRREAERLVRLTRGIVTVDDRLTVLSAKSADWKNYYTANSDRYVYDAYFDDDLYLPPGPHEID